MPFNAYNKQAQVCLPLDGTLDKFHINIDVYMPKMPCDIIGLNLQDSMGNQVNDYYGDVHKHRIAADGSVVSISSW